MNIIEAVLYGENHKKRFSHPDLKAAGLCIDTHSGAYLKLYSLADGHYCGYWEPQGSEMLRDDYEGVDDE